MNAVRRQWHLFALALQFLTRIPVPASVPWTEAAMHASARYFPAVGVLVGAFGALVWWGAQTLWPALIAVLLSMSATVWLTGAFHEDGWADTCDGLGGSVSRERALHIMKDSRLGSYGALGLVLLLALKAAALASLPPACLPVLMVWTHALSRMAPLVLMRTMTYAGDAEHAKAKPMAQQATATTLWVAAATLVAVAGVLVVVGANAPGAGLESARHLPKVLVACLAGGALSTLVAGRWFWRRLGGYTGDTLGASQQLAEVAALLGALAVCGIVSASA